MSSTVSSSTTVLGSATELSPTTGQCNCGALRFRASGPIRFNVLCHCRNCARARGVSPVHILAVAAENFEFVDDFIQGGRGGQVESRAGGDQDGSSNNADGASVPGAGAGEALRQKPESLRVVHMQSLQDPPDGVNAGYSDRMVHAFCSACGAHVYQHPEGAAFRALFPLTFRSPGVFNKTFGADGGVADPKNCLLGERLWPRAHLNYENRLRDWDDSLVKWQKFAGSSPRVNNDGSIIVDEDGG